MWFDEYTRMIISSDCVDGCTCTLMHARTSSFVGLQVHAHYTYIRMYRISYMHPTSCAATCMHHAFVYLCIYTHTPAHVINEATVWQCVCMSPKPQSAKCMHHAFVHIWIYMCIHTYIYTYIYVCIHTIHASTHKLNNASVQERACACLRCSGEARACIIHSSAMHYTF